MDGAWQILRMVDTLNAQAREKQAAQFKREVEHWLAVDQLVRFGICPCLEMGRYSTCCGSKT